jgi:adenylate cyclase
LLVERLAEHVHDIWALKRMREGWRYGPCRSDSERTHPDLMPYPELPSGEQDYDRTTARGTLCAILALGYRIVPPASR